PTEDAPRELARLAGEPPGEQLPELPPLRRIGAIRLGEERHEAEPPGPELAAQLLVAAPMLVEDETARLGGDHMAAAHEAVEDVEIAPAGQLLPGVERLVESPDAPHRVPAHRHVAAGPEDARSAGIRLVARERRAEAHLPEAVTEAAKPLELHLGSGDQLEREHGSGDGGGIRMRRPGLHESLEPARVDRDVVVEIRDELAGGFRQAAVAREVDAGDRLAH